MNFDLYGYFFILLFLYIFLNIPEEKEYDKLDWNIDLDDFMRF